MGGICNLDNEKEEDKKIKLNFQESISYNTNEKQIAQKFEEKVENNQKEFNIIIKINKKEKGQKKQMVQNEQMDLNEQKNQKEYIEQKNQKEQIEQTVQKEKKEQKEIREENELKIELYPENEPRYEFHKESVKQLITDGTIGYSFDINRELAFINKNVPLLNGFFQAHINHYPIRIKPDDIRLLIVQAFSNHVNANSEELRNYFILMVKKH